jgi:hypothetical protein
MSEERKTEVKTVGKKNGKPVTVTEVSGFTVDEAMTIGNLAERSLATTKGKPHFWCGLVHGATAGIRKQFKETLSTLDGYDAYQKDNAKAVKPLPDGRSFISKEDQDKLEADHEGYLGELKEILSTPVDAWAGVKLVISKVPVDWMKKIDGAETLTRLLTEFDLWESTDKLRDSLYLEE